MAADLPKIQMSLERGTNGITHFIWNGATFQPEAKIAKWILNCIFPLMELSTDTKTGYDDLGLYMEYGCVFVSSTGRNHIKIAAFSFNFSVSFNFATATYTLYTLCTIEHIQCKYEKGHLSGYQSMHINETSRHFKTLRPRQNGRHFPNDSFRCIFFNEKVCISIIISRNFIPKGPISNMPFLVQIMVWCRPGDKPLSEPMVVKLLTHKCVTRPHWFKTTNIPINAIWLKWRPVSNSTMSWDLTPWIRIVNRCTTQMIKLENNCTISLFRGMYLDIQSC